MLGAKGFVKLRYLARMSGTWKGQATGFRYPFKQGSVRWVDRLDADCMLAMKTADGPYFEVVDGNAH